MVINRSKSKLISIIFTVFFGLAFQAITLIVSPVSKADVNSTTISWSAAKPITFSSTPSPYLSTGICGGFLQSKKLAGEDIPREVCITLNDKLIFGVYYVGNGNTYLPAVSFPFDSKMYKVNGICGEYDSCLYLPGSDALATKQYLTGGIVKSLVIYKNFTNRLSKIINPANLSTEYNLDTSNPDYIFQNAGGYAWPVGGIGASNNGKWLGVELRERGMGLLDINTLQMKRISNYRFLYNSGMNPVSELAVSNDGAHVAVMGSNAWINVFDVDQTCGDMATDDNMPFAEPITNQCKTSPIETNDFINRLLDAYRPYFSDDGGELSFSATSYTDETRQVSIRAAGYERQMIDYLALGDSFSSGEGESDDKYYLPGTNDEFEKCHVSSRSYPFLVANILNINPLKVKNVACSGATTEDVVGDDDLGYPGQGLRLVEKGLNLNNSNKTLAQNEAKIYFLPGRIHQESFVKTYNPKVVTIGIGGNDTGLMSKLRTCVGQGTCYYAGTPVGKEQTAIEIKRLYETLVQTYQKLHLASPSSKIYVIGYPKVIDSSGQCDLVNGVLLDNTERQFMNEGIAYINQVVKAASKTVGVVYIDTQDSFGGHVLCGSLQPSAMNAIRIGEEGAISESLDFAKVIGSESFHPNALGHSLLASSVVGTAGNIMTNNYCADGAVICPIKTPAPDPSDYWISGLHHDYPAQKIATCVYDRDDAYDNRQKKILVPDTSLEPNSSVTVEITSNPRLLGQFQVSATGSLTADIDLPIDLEEGYHTIHLYGTSFSGESIELYQIIEYLKPVADIKNQPAPTVIDVPQTETKKNDLKDVNVDQDEKPTPETQIMATNEEEKQDIKKPVIEDNQVSKSIIESDIISESGVVKGASITANEEITPKPNIVVDNTDKTTQNYEVWDSIIPIFSVFALALIGFATIHKLRS